MNKLDHPASVATVEMPVESRGGRARAFFERHLEQQVLLKRSLQRAQTATEYFFIDIVGNCNLRCPSCPVPAPPDAC